MSLNCAPAIYNSRFPVTLTLSTILNTEAICDPIISMILLLVTANAPTDTVTLTLAVLDAWGASVIEMGLHIHSTITTGNLGD